MTDTQYARILRKFKNQAHFVHVIGVPQSTVSFWQSSGRIPQRHIENIIRKAGEQNIAISLEDFFPSARPKKRGRAA